MKNTETNLAFTLVELIIVITILAILATIGFMSFQTYTTDARDGKRKTDLSEVRKGLEIYQTKNGILPTPDDKIVTVYTGTTATTIALQGYMGTKAQKDIRISEVKDDDNEKIYYTYSVNASKTKYRLLAMLENKENLAMKNNLVNQTYARINYETRHPYTVGNYAVFFSGTTNTPLQNITGTGLDLASNNTQIHVIISGTGTTTFTGSDLPTAIETETNSSAGASSGGEEITQITCPTGYILVPGNSTFSTTDFCVAKYEMKNVGGVATSQSALTPWVSITQPRAITACNNLGAGYHLITNNEWMTIARNIEANSQNWANGTVGSLVSAGGGLYRGNVNLNDSASCGSNTVLDGDTAGTNCDNGSGRNKRMHKLSNGNDIWDISGNVREHINGTNNKSSTNGEVANGNACSGDNRYSWNSSSDGVSNACTFTNTTPAFYSKSNQGPAGDYNALNGVGRIYSGTRANIIFLRGGGRDDTDYAGVFTLFLDFDSTDAATYLGFRCAF